MQLLRGLHNPGLGEKGCVATIGNFDGVHRGHQAIIERVIHRANEFSVPALVIVFEPQPLEFFNQDAAPPRLMTFREKFGALAEFDLDYVFCLKFDASLAGLSAEAFVERVLVEHLHIRHLVVGDDFRFGDDRAGDFALLESLGQCFTYSVENTPTCTDGAEGADARISSTRIRACLEAGQLPAAASLLGRPYRMTGKVVHGEKLGRQLGFPTANVNLNRIKLPMTGVFVVKVKREDGSELDGVANLGVKPSVGRFKPNLEVYVLNFDDDLYGEAIEVEFRHQLRDEQRFDGLDALKRQIAVDVEAARQYLASN